MSWTVGSVMSTDVVTAGPQTTYRELVERMQEHRVSALPIVDADGRVVGIVSEADLLLKEERPAPRLGGHLIDPHGDAARAHARTAAALMTSPAITVTADRSLREAARAMHRLHVKRLPVVDDSGRLVGIVSRADLLMTFMRSDESIVHEVREDVLARALAIEPDSLKVTSADGIVRLEGELETRTLAGIVTRLAGAVEGVVAVDDRLRWRLDDSRLRVEAPPMADRLAASEREGGS